MACLGIIEQTTAMPNKNNASLSEKYAIFIKSFFDMFN